MLEIPEDENTNVSAITEDSIKVKSIYVEEEAGISISLVILPDTVSTGQTFSYTVIGELENNLIQQSCGKYYRY